MKSRTMKLSPMLLLPLAVVAGGDRQIFLNAAEASAPKERETIICLNFTNENSRLFGNGDFIDGIYQKRTTEYGKLPRARFEGTTLKGLKVGPQSMRLVPSFSPQKGQAIRYTLGPQGTDMKARTEHYLHAGEMNRTYCSEFSMMLDPDMTIAEKIRAHDNGPNWVILRQWHQSAPESPPMALQLVPETKNVITTSIRYGDHNRAAFQTFRGKKTLVLGKWYHFRYQWHVAPGTDKSHLKVWLSDKRWGDELEESDVLFEYRGPIGYTLKDKPESEINKMSRVIREQQGIYQGAHRSDDSLHAIAIANVRVYQMP